MNQYGFQRLLCLMCYIFTHSGHLSQFLRIVLLKATQGNFGCCRVPKSLYLHQKILKGTELVQLFLDKLLASCFTLIELCFIASSAYFPQILKHQNPFIQVILTTCLFMCSTFLRQRSVIEAGCIFSLTINIGGL